ncbi:MAG: hypothetical protein JKY60_14135 [Kordiimonadaceae bacterium]|nr:hypothetical protein [Kordiimonadaceae bacterium]
MLELYKSEFSRYRKWSLMLLGALLGVFLLVSKLKPILEGDALQNFAFTAYAILGSLIFGVVQMLLHKRTNHWTYLVHRPLSAHKIYAAIAGAGFTVLFIAVALPWWVVTLSLDAFTNNVVDNRHYVYPLFLLLTSYVTYLIGSLVILNPNKGVIALMIMLYVLIAPTPDGMLTQFLPPIVLVGVLLYLNFMSFKVDLSTHTQKPLTVILMAVPMSLALAFLLQLSTAVFYHIPLFILDKHPDNHPVKGSYSYLWSESTPAKRLAYALEGSDHPKAAYFIKQVELADEGYISPDHWTFPRRGQMYNKDRQFELRDTTSNTSWHFSHDSMLLEGRNVTTRKRVGVVGMNGFLDSADLATPSDRFDEVPFMVGDKLLATTKVIYSVNFADRVLTVKFKPEAGEYFISRPQLSKEPDYASVATNKRSLIFDKAEFFDENIVVVPEYSLPHPVDPANINYCWTYQLVDGYLFLCHGRDYFGFGRGGTELIHAKLGGTNELIASREYTVPRMPAWVHDFNNIVSPAATYVTSPVLRWMEPAETGNETFSELRARDYPTYVYWVTAFFALFSMVGVFVMTRRHRLNKAQTGTWLVLAAILSLPVLISFFLMNPWRIEKADG